MRYTIPLLLSLAACSTPSGTVEIYGSLRGMMHDNRTEAQVTLATLLPDASRYAVGALSELRGEVTIVAGRLYLSYPENETGIRTVVSSTSGEGAALLVTARVSEWKETRTSAEIPFAQLDRRIAGLVREAGLDVEGVVAIRIEGTVQNLEWHVIDGRRLAGGGASHEEHREAAVKERREETHATIVGFYSQHHHGVFNHHDADTHLHCVVEAPRSSGHVDGVTLPAGTLIRLGLLR